MLLNKLSNEKELTAITDMILDGIPNKKMFAKTYAKALAKSAAQGAIVGFAALGVAAIIVVAVASATDGVIEE